MLYPAVEPDAVEATCSERVAPVFDALPRAFSGREKGSLQMHSGMLSFGSPRSCLHCFPHPVPLVVTFGASHFAFTNKCARAISRCVQRFVGTSFSFSNLLRSQPEVVDALSQRVQRFVSTAQRPSSLTMVRAVPCTKANQQVATKPRLDSFLRSDPEVLADTMQRVQQLACTAFPSAPTRPLPQAQRVPVPADHQIAATVSRDHSVTRPAGPAQVQPPLVTDLRAMLTMHIEMRPDWLHGPLLHMPPRHVRGLMMEPPSAEHSRLFTVFDCRLDHCNRGARPTWSTLDYMTAAVHSVPYRVRLIWFCTRNMPGLPTPQIALTAPAAPPGHRSLPIDLREVGGLIHTINVPSPCAWDQVWGALTEKGVDPSSTAQDAHLNGHLAFFDERGRLLSDVPAGDHAPEWIVLRRITAIEVLPLAIAYEGERGYPPRMPTTTTTTMHPRQGAEPIAPETPDLGPASEPPALLFSAPRHGLPKGYAEEARSPLLLPAYLAGARVRDRAVCSFTWGGVDDGDEGGRFTVLDTTRHLTLLPKQQGATLRQVITAAIAAAPFPVQAIQVLIDGLVGLPRPQIVLFQAGEGAGPAPIPWDLRAVGAQVRTALHVPGETFQNAARRLRATLAEDPSVCDAILAGRLARRPAVSDAMGMVGRWLPADLEEVQHFRVQPALFPPAGIVTQAWDEPAGFGGSSTTSTTSVQGVPMGTLYVLTLVHGQATYTLPISSPCYQFEAILEHLVLEVLAQNSWPGGPPYAVVAGAQPPRREGVQEILMALCHGPEAGHATIIVDERPRSYPLLAHTGSAARTCAQLISQDAHLQGIQAYINGAPSSLLPRQVSTGDYIQFAQGTEVPDFTSLSAILDLIPILEAFTWPQPLGPSARHLDIPGEVRVRRRLQSPRVHWEGTCEVLGPHHGPVRFRLTVPQYPSLEEMMVGLARLPECPAAVLQVVPAPSLYGRFAAFATFEQGTSYRSVFMPRPGRQGQHIPVMLLPDAVEFRLPLPEGGIYKLPRRPWEHGNVIEVLVLSPAFRPFAYYMARGLPLPEGAVPGGNTAGPVLREGTALAQIRRIDPSRRCQGLREARVAEGCLCRNGRVECPKEPAADGHLPQAQTGHSSVPTPFGRRLLPPARQDLPAREPTHICLADRLPTPPAAVTWEVDHDIRDAALAGHRLTDLDTELPLAMSSNSAYARL